MARSGQGSIEYIMIIAVVLVLALMVVGLSLFFTSTSGELSQTEIETYWATQTRPIRILSMEGYYYKSGFSTNGEIALVLQNVDSRPVYLRNIILTPSDTSQTMKIFANHSSNGGDATGLYGYAGEPYRASPGFSITLAPSEKVNVFIRGNSSGFFCNDANDSVHFRKTITLQYNSSYFGDLFFTGNRPIQGRCNQIG